MLFRHLSISGLGPFGGSHDIDFDALTSDGLFLLEGPTGSGKSSLIDAIVFALYDSVAGKDSDDSRIRSTHADPMSPSRVRLVFTVDSGTYTVTRTPRWNRPKTRGTGTTTVNATATLIRLSEQAVEEQDWENGQEIATGSRNVGIELTNILHLTREQFVQTVVLPQGQFATFLRLKSDERSAILETLFATGDYRKMTDMLRSEAAQAQKSVDSARTELDHALKIWLSNEGVSPWSERVNDLHGRIIDHTDREVLEVLAEANEELQRLAENSTARAETLRIAEEKANADLDAARALNKAISERTALAERLAILDADEERITALRSALDMHEKASFPARIYQRKQQASAELNEALTVAPEALHMTTKNVTDSGELSAMLTQAVSELIADLDRQLSVSDAEIGRLDPIVAVEAGLPERRKNLDTVVAELSTLQTTAKELKGSIAALPSQREALSTQLRDARDAANKISNIEAQMELLVQVDRVLSDYEAAATALEKAEQAHRSNLDKATQSFADFGRLSALRFQSLATELADQLIDGKPCQVCGSVEHPAPAGRTGTRVTREEVEAAQRNYDRARTAVEKSAVKLEATKTTRIELAKQLGDMTRSQYEAELEELAAQLAVARRAGAEVTVLEAEITQLTQREHEAQQTLSEAQAEIATHTTTIEHLTKQIVADDKLVENARGESDSVQKRLAELNAHRDLLRTERTRTLSIAHLLEAVVDLQEQLAEALLNVNMSLDTVLQAVMPDSDYQAAKQVVANFDSEHAKIEGALENPEIVAAINKEQRDLEPLELTLENARMERQEADRRAFQAVNSAQHAIRDYEAVAQSFDQWTHEAVQAGPVVRLAQLANADAASLTKVSLPNWVLLKRFEIVIARANEYLLEFSRGRFELRRAAESNREKRTGLGLEVIDHAGGPHGDEIRQTGTLSGGETFFTSLSLALALAEVVQEENGGVRIETLMIDEGFGTLSQDVLDVVMDTLKALTVRGRRVGVISHVEELKMRIQNRVSIKPSPRGGSTITVVS